MSGYWVIGSVASQQGIGGYRKADRNLRHEESKRYERKSAASVCQCLECWHDTGQKRRSGACGIQQKLIIKFVLKKESGGTLF